MFGVPRLAASPDDMLGRTLARVARRLPRPSDAGNKPATPSASWTIRSARPLPAFSLILAVVAAITGACGSPPPGQGSSASASRLASGLAPGAQLDAFDVEAALEEAVAAGPATFEQLDALAATDPVYFQAIDKKTGTLDLATSRGLAVYEGYPGLPNAFTYDTALVGNQTFIRLDDAAGWQKASGGARSFVGLDVPGESAVAVIQAALPPGMWEVIESNSDDPPGSIRVKPEASDEVVVVIDATGRLVSITRSMKGDSGSGRVVHELTLLAFGVPFDFVPPE
jgi:hypothetical protein